MVLSAQFRLCLPLAVAALLAACGDGTRRHPRSSGDDDVRQLTTDDAFAEDYFLADLPCQEGAGAPEIGRRPVHMWQGDATREVSFPFERTSSESALRGPGIDVTSFGFHQVDSCATPDDGPGCGAETGKVEQTPKPLKICKPDAPYPRTSVEGVALASLANLVTASEFYRLLPNRSPSMRRAGLVVLPTVEKVYADGAPRQVVTDNLAYHPSYDGAPVFVVFPKGRRAAQKGMWAGLNLWELPWGLAHEFGHHVFRTHTGVATGFAPLTLAPRAFGPDEIWSAVNEGFADLYAFYVSGGEPGMTANVDCFEAGRDVASGAFLDGTPKILTKEALDLFLSPERRRPPPCRTPDFQDVHSLGAVLAYGVEQLFEAEAGLGRTPASAMRKAQFLLAWANRAGETARATPAKSLTLDLILQDALHVVASDRRLNEAQCEAMRRVFPTFAPNWLAAGFRCE